MVGYWDSGCRTLSHHETCCCKLSSIMPYMLEPLEPARWNYTAAAHLLNRAGFGGPPDQIEKIAALPPEQAVSQLLDYDRIPDNTPNPEWAKPDPERAERLRALRMASPEQRRQVQREQQQKQQQRLTELRGWWLQRMANGPRPLQEKLTLFWHGHFATSMVKVRDAYLMWRQNDLFRRLGAGNWQELLVEVAKDPAMLVWLDQAQSRKEHPNENFAREVMELFALGEGHYTEKDVTEAARALTGWSYDRRTQCSVERPAWHDSGEKIIFSQRGDFGPEDFLRLVVAHPQAPRFITGKLWTFFAGEEPPPALANALANSFRASGFCFKPLLRAMFSSQEFYASGIIRKQVKSPVHWLVGAVRVLERELPPPQVCVALTRNLGQNLFAPPNVKGWDGGLSWITTNTLLSRYNEAATLLDGDVSVLRTTPAGQNRSQSVDRRWQRSRVGEVQVSKLFKDSELSSSDTLIQALEKRLLQGRLKPEREKIVRDFLSAEGSLTEAVVLDAMRLVMSTPEFQLT
jgi:uncharacterized protein (DUF1800 family)